jgi:O-antigen/teichoic acid export membrane protein
MLTVTALTGVLGWVSIFVAGHRLGPAGYARFAVIWGLLFGLGGAFSGLQQEITRATFRASPDDEPVWRKSALVAVFGCVIAGVGIVVVRPADVGDSPTQVLLVVGALAGFASLTFVNGVLTHHEQWSWIAAVLILDAVVRTVAVIVVLDRHDDADATLVAVIGVGAFAWLVLLATKTVRSVFHARGADPSGFAWRAGSAILAAGCTSALVAGFPFLLALVNPGPLDARTGALLAGLVLVRSPLLLVLFGLRPVLMRAFLGSARPVRDLLRVWTWCGAVATLGCLVALAIGGPVLALLMGDEFRIRGWQLAVMLCGSAELGMLMVSGLALIASDRHLWSTLGWLVALLMTVALLAIPGSTEHAMLFALSLGPVGGLAVHAAALHRAGGLESPKPT